MRDKWVDNSDYFGPDRRRRTANKRWGERRHADEAGQPPPLGAMLRRVRVHLLGASTPDDRRRTLQLLGAAIVDAERRQLFKCADCLKKADGILRSAVISFAGAEALVTEAMSWLATGQ